MINLISLKTIKLAALSCMALLLSGCATLTYSGPDYDANNIQSVKTNEDFVFSVYKKTTNGANIKMGISRTPVPEILALFVQVENLSYETPYVFRVDNLKISNPDEELKFITSANYLNIYQTQESASMAAMSNMGSALSNMTGMMANYNDINQSMVQNQAEQTNKSAYTRIDAISNQISAHSIKTASTIHPRKSQYFYFFFEDLDKFPIKVFYKDLSYEFRL